MQQSAVNQRGLEIRYFMNLNFLKSKFAKNTSWLIIGQIYQMIISFLVGIFSARYLGPSNYGLINYASSFVILFTAFCTLGIENIIINELIRNKDKEGEICGSAIGLRLMTSTVCMVVIVILSSILNPGETLTVQITAVYSMMLVFKSFDIINAWYQSKLLSKINTIISCVAFTVTAVYKIVLLVFQKSVIWFAATSVIEYGLVAVLLMYSYNKNNHHIQPLVFRKETAKNLLSKSYHFIISGMMVAIYGQMDKIMLKAMLDETSVGIYAAANTINGLWIFVLAAIVSSARPIILELFSKDKIRYEERLVQLYSVVLYFASLVAAGLCILAQFIIFILYGKAFIAAKTTLRILSWSTAFSYIGVVRSIWIVPNGKQHYEKYIAASGAVCNLILNYLLIPQYGANGAAVATLLTQFFTNFVIGFFIGGIRYNNLLVIKGFLLPFSMIKRYLGKERKNGT